MFGETREDEARRMYNNYRILFQNPPVPHQVEFFKTRMYYWNDLLQRELERKGHVQRGTGKSTGGNTSNP